MVNIQPFVQSLRTGKEPFPRLALALEEVQSAIDTFTKKFAQMERTLAPQPSRLIPASVPGKEYADLVIGLAVRVEQKLEGAVWRTYLYPTFAWPNDPNCAGVEIEVRKQDGTLLDSQSFGRQSKADNNTLSNWFNCPAEVITVNVRALSYSFSSTSMLGGRTNSYVVGVTPEVQVQIGRTGGVVDVGKADQGSLGDGLAISANRLLANIAGVLGFEAGAIKLQLGSGVQDYLGALYVKVAQGLGFDVSGNVQIPTYGIGQTLLENGPIINAGRLVNYVVSQIKLENAQIVDAVRIVDLNVLRQKVGFSAVGAQQIGAAEINDAHINNLSANKLTAGTATFTGDLTIANTGGIHLQEGAGIYAQDLTISQDGFLNIGGAWVISGVFGQIAGQSSATSIVSGNYGTYSGGIGQSVALPYKKADGSNGNLYFNSGLLTSCS
jgi:hypothetical protein